jgi:REP element-mobilizing transposase RayT
MTDHLHILLKLRRTIDVAKLVGDIKSNSSRWIKSIDPGSYNFAWQKGYAAYSVGQMEFDRVAKYIQNQKEHHKTSSFKEEYIKFLQYYKIEYDEKYVWD